MNEYQNRNRFFAWLGLFVLCFCVIAIISPMVAIFQIRTYSYEIFEDKKILFIGDSYVGQGVDDAVIPHAFNYACSADTFLTGFLRLRLVVRDNPQIDTVFLSVTPYNLSKGADEMIFRPSLVGMKVPYYLPHFGVDEWKLFLERAPVDFLRAVFMSPTVYLRKSKLQNRKYFKKLGHFNPRENKTLKKAIAGTMTLERDVSWTNDAQLIYLRKICDFCREKNLRLVFLSTPVYQAEKYTKLDDFYSLVKTKFSEFEFWDYTNYPMLDDEREDIGHLNAFGARTFAKVLAERLEKEAQVRPVKK